MTVRDLLRDKGDELFTIEPNDTVFEAIAKMSDQNVGSLLVMSDDKLRGIITERDYRTKVILKGRTSKTTRVSEIMTPDVFCISPDRTVKECMAIVTEKKFRHLPVLDNNKVVGLVSIGDLVKAIISEQRMEIDHLTKYISGSYPA